MGPNTFHLHMHDEIHLQLNVFVLYLFHEFRCGVLETFQNDTEQRKIQGERKYKSIFALTAWCIFKPLGCHLDCTSRHSEIFEKVSISNKQLSVRSVSESRCERMNTLIIVIMTGSSISPLQYVGCINVSGTAHAFVKGL